MAAYSLTLTRLVSVLAGATLIALAVARPVAGQILPWEVTVAEIEAGRLRHLAQRLNKQNVLYQLRVGNVSKEDLIKTASEIVEVFRLPRAVQGVVVRQVVNSEGVAMKRMAVNLWTVHEAGGEVTNGRIGERQDQNPAGLRELIVDDSLDTSRLSRPWPCKK